MVEALVVDQSVQPGVEARAPLEAANRAVDLDEGVLYRIAGLLLVPEDAQGERVGAALVALHQDPEGLVIALLGPSDDLLFSRFCTRLLADPVFDRRRSSAQPFVFTVNRRAFGRANSPMDWAQ